MTETKCPTLTKQCKKCKDIKTIDNYYYHARDGYETICKCCRKADRNEYRINNREIIRQRNKEEYLRNLSKRKEYKKRYRANNLKGNLAHVKVYRAKRKGIIIPSSLCNCGREVAIAHHSDYDKPLDVIWMCTSCHIRLHKAS